MHLFEALNTRADAGLEMRTDAGRGREIRSDAGLGQGTQIDVKGVLAKLHLFEVLGFRNQG